MQNLRTKGIGVMAVLATTIMLALVARAHLSAAMQPRSESLVVKSVPDGATLTVDGLGRITLLGIEVPASRRGKSTASASGRLARRRLTELALGRWVRLERPRDGRGRGATPSAAYVFRDDGLFLNEQLVRDGLARVSGTAGSRQDALRRAEAEARRWKKGGWADGIGNEEREMRNEE